MHSVNVLIDIFIHNRTAWDNLQLNSCTTSQLNMEDNMVDDKIMEFNELNQSHFQQSKNG